MSIINNSIPDSDIEWTNNEWELNKYYESNSWKGQHPKDLNISTWYNLKRQRLLASKCKLLNDTI